MNNIVNALINRVKNLQEFEIYAHIDNHILFDGVIPFDMTIKNNVATFKVFALNKEEAHAQVNNWLKDRV